MRRLAATLAAAGLTLAACASHHRSPSRPSSAPPTPVPVNSPPAAPPPSAAPVPAPETSRKAGFDDLPGWRVDDHAAALRAFAAACVRVRNVSLAGACGRALALGAADGSSAREFFEQNFRPVPTAAAAGLLTGYFAPIYPARVTRAGEFTAPVRPRPRDLAAAVGRYADRRVIEARPAPDALAWMRPEDLFFLQIQGSGVLVFADGRQLSAASDGTNGAPFVGLARPMRAAGFITDDHSSADAIRAWLQSHRGAAAAAMMDLNPRYVFFRTRADTGADPTGAAGAPLRPGRAVAIDPARHRYGELLWIDATDPAISGARPSYRRLVVALDTGGAIRGEARADLYLGRGPGAGAEAGQVRHRLRLYRLEPIERQADAAPR
ncbi:MAG: MltA domain-containing protein [Caulobacteraceae bacterium]